MTGFEKGWRDYQRMVDTISPFLKEAWQYDVVTVTSAGNEGVQTFEQMPDGSLKLTEIDETAGNSFPNNFGTNDEGMIVVGGVWPNGQLYVNTVPSDDRTSISVYAQGANVDLAFDESDETKFGKVPWNPSKYETRRASGTSFAAPAVVRLS